jgi:hypothetical protein
LVMFVVLSRVMLIVICYWCSYVVLLLFYRLQMTNE